MGRHTPSDSERNLKNLKQEAIEAHSKYLSGKQPDYLLEFAKNERTSQINWINSEITHLTELKNILESNNCKKNNKPKVSQKNPCKTSVYKIIQKGETGVNSAREYIIQTKFDDPVDKKINYRLKGKEYLIADNKIPQKSTNVNKDNLSNPVIADIKIQSEKNQTKIKVSKLCDSCKKISCECQSSPPSIVKREENDTGYDLPENFNSLQKIFQKCRCTADAKKCSCSFVKNLFRRIMTNKDMEGSQYESSGAYDIRFKSLFKDNETQTTLLSRNIQSKEQLVREGFEINEISENYSNNHDIVQSVPLAIPKTTENLNLFKTPSLSYKTVESKTVNYEEQLVEYQDKTAQEDMVEDRQHYLSTDEIEGFNDKSIKSSDKHRPKDTMCNLESITTKYKDVDVQVTTELLKVSPENDDQTEDISLNLKKITKSEDIIEQLALNSQDKLEPSRDFVPTTNQTTKNITVSSTEQFFSENKFSSIKNCTKREENDLKLESEILIKFKDMGIQTVLGSNDDNSQCSKDLTTKVTQTNGISTTQSIKKFNEEYTTNSIRRDIETNLKNSNLNLTSVIGNKQKNIGVQSSFELKNHSTQTSIIKSNKREYSKQNGFSSEGQCNSTDKTVNLDHQGNSSNKMHNKKSSSLDIKKVDMVSGSKSETSNLEFEEKDTPKRTTTLLKDEPASNGTSTNYTHSGGTSASIPTSVLDSQSTPSSKLLCNCCKKKTFHTEISCIRNRSPAYTVCSKYCCNKPAYIATNFHCKCKSQKWKETGPLPTCNKCYNCKLMGSVQIPKAVAYNLTFQEPVLNKNKKHVTNVRLQELNNDKLRGKESKKKKDNVNIDQSIKNDEHKSDKFHPQLAEEKIPQYAVTDYLIINRPRFIYSAEYRRQCVLNSRILREHRKDTAKLNFLENNLNNRANADQYKLFTEREMKEINKKNYQKLPEVQKKLSAVKERQLRNADRVICDIFAKKVQKSVLKGRRDFPIDKTITNL